MGLKSGIVGLPNVGKSTLFNALTKAGAEVSNYPFTTIEPNMGVVPVRDERLVRIAELVRPERVVPATVEFVDIAGLVRGASRGEGLGNQFLAHIREVDALCHIVRCFEKEDVAHTEGELNPERDIDTINTELILADIETLERRIAKLEKPAISGDKKAGRLLEASVTVKKHLEDGRPARTLPDELIKEIKELNLLTAKPVIYVANTSEEVPQGLNPHAQRVKEVAHTEGAGFVSLCARLEAELAELEEEDRREFMKELAMEETGIDRLVKESLKVLGLITFFTIKGGRECRAWLIKEGTRVQKAAGRVHTDFEKGFIKAEVMGWKDLLECGSETACRQKGLVRIEGRDYVVRDGDIISFRFAL